MPFKSEKQRAFMYAKHPEIAKRWSREEKQAALASAAKRKLEKSDGRRTEQKPD